MRPLQDGDASRPSIELVPGCPLCGATGVEVLALKDVRLHVPGIFRYAHCESCSVHWLVNRFAREDIHRAYPRDSYYSFAEEPPPKDDWAQRALRARYAGGPVLQRLLGAKLQAYPPSAARGAVLDVGTGTGSRLHRLRRLGWTCGGVEPDADAVATARAHGLDVRIGTAEALSFGDELFDVVLLAHSIEHCHDPARAVQEAWRVLRPGGWIVVTTPNTRSANRILWGRHWVHWEPSRHLVLFDRTSLPALISEQGFSVVGIRGTASGAGLIDSALLRFGRPSGRRAQMLSRYGAVGVALLTNWHPWADEMEVTARKLRPVAHAPATMERSAPNHWIEDGKV